MTKETVKGNIESAYGKPLSEYGKDKLTYEGEVDLFENVEEVKEAGEWPSNAEVVKLVNQRRVASKRQGFIKASLDAAGIKAPTLEDKGTAINAMVKVLVAQGKTEEAARALAEQILS